MHCTCHPRAVGSRGTPDNGPGGKKRALGPAFFRLRGRHDCCNARCVPVVGNAWENEDGEGIVDAGRRGGCSRAGAVLFHRHPRGAATAQWIARVARDALDGKARAAIRSCRNRRSATSAARSSEISRSAGNKLHRHASAWRMRAIDMAPKCRTPGDASISVALIELPVARVYDARSRMRAGPAPAAFRRPCGPPTKEHTMTKDNKEYGEGNYKATRDYNERTKRFIESGQVEEAAQNAAPQGCGGSRGDEGRRADRSQPREGRGSGAAQGQASSGRYRTLLLRPGWPDSAIACPASRPSLQVPFETRAPRTLRVRRH